MLSRANRNACAMPSQNGKKSADLFKFLILTPGRYFHAWLFYPANFSAFAFQNCKKKGFLYP